MVRVYQLIFTLIENVSLWSFSGDHQLCLEIGPDGNQAEHYFLQSKEAGTLPPLPCLHVVRQFEQGLDSLTLVNINVPLAGF